MALAISIRKAPTSWTDDLDWDNIDTGDARYLQALQMAVAERCSVYNGKNALSYLRNAWWATPSGTARSHSAVRGNSQAQAVAVEVAIKNLASRFVIPLEYGDYAEDLSDFPKYWTYAELVRAVQTTTETTIGTSPTCGVPMYESAQYLKFLKEMLSLLYLTEFAGSYSYYQTSSGDGNITPDGDDFSTLEEAIADVKQTMTDEGLTWRRSTMRSGQFRTIQCYSTATLHGGIFTGEDEKRLDYYCEIWDLGWKLEAIFGGEGLKPNILLVLYMRKPEREDFVADTEAPVETVFDPVDTGLPEGISTLSYPYGTKDVILHDIASDIPTPPEPVQRGWQEESDGTPYMDYSYSAQGFIARVCPCLDYRESYKFK